MKRFLAVFAALWLMVSMWGCVGSEPAPSQTATTGAAGGFQVGYGRVDISPYYESVPLAGYGNTSTRMSDGIGDRLYTTCVAFTDENGETVLLFHNDLCSPSTVGQDMRESVSEATGIPVDHIMYAATHTHSAPDLGNTAERSIVSYRTMLRDWTVQAAQQALADRKPASMEIASAMTENLTFVRHYYVSDGGMVAENYGLLGSRSYVSHCHDADGQMQLVRFVREGGKDVVLVNWQSHPTRYGKTTNASADFISPLRIRLEEKLDCHMAYFTGAAGNLNPGSRISGEVRTQDYEEMGNLLADYAVEALKEPTPVNTGNVQITAKTVTAQVDKSEADLVSQAVVIRDMWLNSNNYDLTMEAANQNGMNSQWHASGIITRNTRLGDTISMELHAFSIGDVGFVIAPYEMFDQNGVQIKEGSPFAMTFVVELANDGNGYIASMECAAHGCYGYDSRSFGSIGDAEMLVTEYLGMLETLHKTK